MKAVSILPIWLYALSVPLFAQEAVTGYIVDKSDGTPVPYVSIGIRNSDIGTVSDEGGIFRLVLPKNSGKTGAIVIFSSVGYLDTQIAVSELKDSADINVGMKPLVHEIPEVGISSRPPKEVVYGNRARSRTTYYNFYNVREEFDDGLGRELGKVLKVAPDIKLREFGFYVAGNPFKKIKFRMNLYDLSGETAKKIQLAKDILFDVEKQNEWVKIDLTDYEVYLKGYEKIGVTIQWLQSEDDGTRKKYFSIPAGLIASNGAMFRSKSEAPWEFPKVNISMYLKAFKY